MTLHDELRSQAASQHGLVSSDQARLLRATPAQMRQLLDSREWRRLTPRVLGLVGSPPTPAQGAMASVLDAGPGAVLAVHSSLGMWQAPGFRIAPHHVSSPRRGIERRGNIAVTHTSRRFPPHHITVLDGIPLTTPARTLFDIAPLINPLRTERILDRFWSDRLVSAPQLFEMAAELSGRGRNMKVMRALLDARGEGYVPPASSLEHRFHWIIENDGQEPLDRQVDVGDQLEWFGRVDARDVLARVIFETDSDRHHAAHADRRDDASRQARLEAAGFTVCRFDEHDIWYSPDHVAEVSWRVRQDGRRRHGAPLLLRRRAQTSAA